MGNFGMTVTKYEWLREDPEKCKQSWNQLLKERNLPAHVKGGTGILNHLCWLLFILVHDLI